jgi:hypothetical protein
MCLQLLLLVLAQVLSHTKALAVWGLLLHLSKGAAVAGAG